MGRVSEVRRLAAEGLVRRRRDERKRLVLRLPADADRRPLAHEHRVDMADGKVKGYFVMGENPVVGSMNGPLQRKGLRSWTGWWCAISS